MTDHRFAVICLCAGLTAVHLPTALAEDEPTQDQVAARVVEVQSQQPCTYGQKVNEKALRMVANFSSSLLEIPKNIVNTTNDSNIFYGLSGGMLKGFIHFFWRMSTSGADLISLPVPTKAIAYPYYVWDDFNQDTTYGTPFRSDTCPETQTVATPIPETKPRSVAVPPRQAVDTSEYDRNRTNQKLDKVFKQEMMK